MTREEFESIQRKFQELKKLLNHMSKDIESV